MMKKTLLTAVLAAAAFSAQADEGMWTLYDLPQPIYRQMCAEGFALPYDKLYQSDDAVMKSVVNFSGYCSGVVVSPEGLVLTNHHCGFDAIRTHSTVEHDYMRDGFFAATQADELPNKDMFVRFMVSQRDVTAQLRDQGILDITSTDKLQDALDSIENAWGKLTREKDSTLVGELLPFYEANKFYYTTYREFRDVRLVFNIPKSMGKFGGETDNWMWPRQTCDFSVFRVYADPKTNGPAEYSKDNVPYRPDKWAQVSMDGYKDGDFSMTIGYPGSTSRYISSYGIRQRRDGQNDPTQQVRGVKQEVMFRHMQADQATRIMYETKYANSSNYWKNSIGMNKCIDSVGLIRQKADFERRIQAWQDSTGYLAGKLSLNRLKDLYAYRAEAVRVRTFFNETFRRQTTLMTRAQQVADTTGVKETKGKKYFQWKDDSKEWDLQTDKDITVALLDNYRRQVAPQWLPAFYDDIDKLYGGSTAKYVDMLYAKTRLLGGKKAYLSKLQKDPAVRFGHALSDIKRKINIPLDSVRDEIWQQNRYLCDARLRMEQDMPHYSDANFTMRLSYGQVGEYKLGGKPSGYYTDAASLAKKLSLGDAGTTDYKAEPIMKELFGPEADFGRYADTTTGKMQLCFLTNNDITGGNSGSPMFDGKGRLIGLAFDGNWDSLSSDIFFDRDLARCIGVDIRYVVYMIDHWGKAKRLVEELGINN